MSETLQPNFFIIGAPKCATTSLASLLTTHPQAGIVQNKEVNFFSHDKFYAQGWERYLQLFSHCVGRKAIGDASTAYSRIRYYPNTISRLHQHVPNARIIYMVRHPLQRMESAYFEHASSRGCQVFPSINEAVRAQPMIIDSSRYWEVFDAYRQKFDESRIKIVWFEEYVANRTAIFQDVCRFLEIDNTFAPDFSRELTNSRRKAPERMAQLGRENVTLNTTWNEETRAWVIDQIREDNLRFLAHFGKPKSFWGDLF